jgi:hypothetical protein
MFSMVTLVYFAPHWLAIILIVMYKFLVGDDQQVVDIIAAL